MLVVLVVVIMGAGEPQVWATPTASADQCEAEKQSALGTFPPAPGREMRARCVPMG